MTGPSLTNTKSLVGAPGPKTMGGYFTSLATASADYVPLAQWDCTHIPNKRITLSVLYNDMRVRFSGYVDKGLLNLYVIGEVTIKAGDTHVFTIDFPVSSMLIEVKPVTAGLTAAIGGGYSGVTTDSTRTSTLSYESLTVTSATAVAFTRDLMLSVWQAMITVEDNPIRFRLDGTAPTTTEGHLLQAGDTLEIHSTFDALNFQCIATGGDAIIRVSYSR